MKLVEGGSHDQHLPFVCPWCGERFAARSGDDSLDAHWLQNPACAKNRNVSSQLNDKNHPLGMRPVMPGEDTMRRVREKEET